MIAAQMGTDSILLAPQSQTAAATVTANFDTRGAAYATLHLAFAAEINTNATGPTISLLESDDTVVTNFATITANRTDEDCTAARPLTYHVDLRGRKRYLRLSITTGTHTTNDLQTIAVLGTLSRKFTAPSATTDMAGAAVLV